MRSRLSQVLTAVAMALLATAIGRADWTATLQFEGSVAPGVGTNYSLDGGLHYTGTTAGSYLHKVTNYTGAGRPNLVLEEPYPYPAGQGVGYVTLFCIDLGQYVDTAAETHTLVDPSTAPRPVTLGPPGNRPMTEIREDWLSVLANRYWTPEYLDIGTESLTTAGYNTAISTNQSYRYAALQLAIWEIIYEGTNVPTFTIPDDRWNVSLGDTRFTGNAATEANRILNNIEILVSTYSSTYDISQVPQSEQQWLGAFVRDDDQDFLVRTMAEAPEPSGVVLAGLGLLGLLCRRKARS